MSSQEMADIALYVVGTFTVYFLFFTKLGITS